MLETAIVSVRKKARSEDKGSLFPKLVTSSSDSGKFQRNCVDGGRGLYVVKGLVMTYFHIYELLVIGQLRPSKSTIHLARRRGLQKTRFA